MDRFDWLAEITTAIADGQPIDWVPIESRPLDARQRGLIQHLRVLEQIACAHAIPSADPLTTGHDSLLHPNPGGESAPPSPNSPVTWGPLTILEKIGSGSFGDVYRAHDPRLDRPVALKLLRRRDQSSDALESVVIEEGRLLARIKHPNVVTVYGAERIDGRVGVWMEFIEGRTLEQQLLLCGPLEPQAVTRIGLDLCRALDAVHRAGLLHRDLKAQNVIQAPDGRIVLTDFGAGREELHSPSGGQTIDLAGTPLYIAPEVFEGQAASVRSEVYSLGVLLFHLASGSFPVRSHTLRDLRDAHTRGLRARLILVRPSFSAAVSAVIERAADPDPSRRYQDTSVLESALRSVVARPPSKGSWGKRRWLGLGVVIAACVAISVIARSAFVDATRGLRTPVPGSQSQLTFVGDAREPALSHDGSAVAYMAGGRLMVQRLAGGQAVQLYENKIARWPAWSPDGSEIVLTPYRPPAELIFVPTVGGSPRILSIPEYVSNAQWSSDGAQVFGRSSRGLLFFDRMTGASRQPRSLGPGISGRTNEGQVVGGRSPGLTVDWSSTTNLLLQVAMSRSGGWGLWSARPDGSQRQQILEDDGASSARWTTTGTGLFYARQTANEVREILWVPIDRSTGAASDKPTVVVGGLDSFDLGFSASDDGGRVAYTRSQTWSTLWESSSTGASGSRVQTKEITGSALAHRSPSISPDGKWVAFAAGPPGARKSNIYKMPVDGGTPVQLTFSNADAHNPAWSPDGRRIAFDSDDGGSRHLWTVNVESGSVREFTAPKIGGTSLGMTVAWWPSKTILLMGPKGTILAVDPDTEEQTPLARSAFFTGGGPRCSPDGSAVAVNTNGGLWLIATGDGGVRRIGNARGPLVGWSPDGTSVLVLAQDHIVSVPLNGAEGRVVLSLPAGATNVAMSPDGRKFIYSMGHAMSDIWLVEIAFPGFRR